ncbi:MAG: hypothetical protein ACJAXW_002697 [Candidatus Azotimanducaceae bacterium]|jgi:hypothetical protein
MTKVLDDRTAQCIGLALDWNDEMKFINQLAPYCGKFGYPAHTVAWLQTG